jgi:hypothetical protein
VSTHVEYIKHALTLARPKPASLLRQGEAFGHAAVRSARAARRRALQAARPEPGRGHIARLLRAPKCVWRCAFCGAEPLFRHTREGAHGTDEGTSYRVAFYDLVDAVCPRGSCTEHDAAPIELRWRHVDHAEPSCAHGVQCWCEDAPQ